MTQNPVSATEPLSLAYSKLIGSAEGDSKVFSGDSLRIGFPADSKRVADEAMMESREVNESIWFAVWARMIVWKEISQLALWWDGGDVD